MSLAKEASELLAASDNDAGLAVSNLKAVKQSERKYYKDVLKGFASSVGLDPDSKEGKAFSKSVATIMADKNLSDSEKSDRIFKEEAKYNVKAFKSLEKITADATQTAALEYKMGSDSTRNAKDFIRDSGGQMEITVAQIAAGVNDMANNIATMAGRGR